MIVATKAVTLSIRQKFGQPWPTWGAIPKDHQELFFQRFKLLIDFVRCLGMPEMKIKGHIGLEIFQVCIGKKKNWASEKGGCMHTSDSIGLQDHAIHLSKELSQSVYVDEVFQQTHLRKDTTGQFVDDRSRQAHEEFEARLSPARSDVASSVGESQLTPLDPAEEQRLRSRCWVAAVGPKRKGHLYGTGDLAHTYKCENDSFLQHTQGSSSRAEDATNINRLKEKLRQSKEEMRVFQSVVLQFLPPEAWNIIHHQQQQPYQQHQDQQHHQADDQQADDQQKHSPDDYFDF
ncbi:hypothetical protein HKD37_18G050956 [Glycine soja]